VSVKIAIDPKTNAIYVMDVIRVQWSPGQIEREIKMAAMCDGDHCTIRIPQGPGGAGRFRARYLAGQLQGYNVRVKREEGSKLYRANPLAAQCEQGYIALVNGPWNQDFIEELCAFPHGGHDDQVNAAAAAFRALCGHLQLHVTAA